jgi:hypothetical protein
MIKTHRNRSGSGVSPTRDTQEEHHFIDISVLKYKITENIITINHNPSVKPKRK